MRAVKSLMIQASIASSCHQVVAAPDASQESVWKARGAIVITSMNDKNKTRPWGQQWSYDKLKVKLEVLTIFF